MNTIWKHLDVHRGDVSLAAVGNDHQRADDLSDYLKFSKEPKHFERVPTKYPDYVFHSIPSESDD
ncbi:MAG: hypothetical protein WAL67_09465 [Candidatus Cybelea sp.]